MVKNVEEQMTLLSRDMREKQPVTDQQILNQGSWLAAFRLSLLASGLDPKELFLSLSIDKSTWSKIVDGHPKFSLPSGKLESFLGTVGNDIPLIWLAYRRGFRLEPLQDAQEKRISELEAKNSELQKEIETLIKYGVVNAPNPRIRSLGS